MLLLSFLCSYCWSLSHLAKSCDLSWDAATLSFKSSTCCFVKGVAGLNFTTFSILPDRSGRTLVLFARDLFMLSVAIAFQSPTKCLFVAASPWVIFGNLLSWKFLPLLGQNSWHLWLSLIREPSLSWREYTISDCDLKWLPPASRAQNICVSSHLDRRRSVEGDWSSWLRTRYAFCLFIRLLLLCFLGNESFALIVLEIELMKTKTILITRNFFPKNVLHFKGLTSAIWRQLDTKTSKVLESYFLKLNLLLNLMELILYYLLLYLKKRLLQEYISICVIYDFIVRIIWRDLQIIICFMRGGKHKLLS